MKTLNNSKQWMLLLFTSLLSIAFSQAQETAKIQAQLSVAKSGADLWIKATAINHTQVKQESLTYELVLVKNSNSCKIIHSGALTVDSGQTLILTKQKIRLGKKESLKYVLLLRQEGNLLSKHSLFVMDRQNFNKANSDNVYSAEGNVFSQYLNTMNHHKNIKYPFRIKLIENPIENSELTEILIMIDNNLIYKFKPLSKPAYLKAAAQETDKKIMAYLYQYQSSLVASD